MITDTVGFLTIHDMSVEWLNDPCFFCGVRKKNCKIQFSAVIYCILLQAQCMTKQPETSFKLKNDNNNNNNNNDNKKTTTTTTTNKTLTLKLK